MVRIISVLIIALLAGCGAGNDRPKGAEDISYWEPAWYDNEHIIYTKQVDTVKFHHGLLAEISNMSSEKVRTDCFICITDLEGKDERILKQFSVIEDIGFRKKREKFMIDGDRKIPLEGKGLYIPTDYSCSSEWIVFKTALSEGNTGYPGPIYIMRPDGSEIRKIVEDRSYNPRLSPDNKQVLYQFIDPEAEWREVRKPMSLWLVNIDGTGNRKLIDDAACGVWSPDGERIAYQCPSITENPGPTKPWRKDIFIYNLKTGENKEFKRGSPPRDWSLNVEPIAGIKVWVGGYTMKPKGQNPVVKYFAHDWRGIIPESIEVISFSLNYERLSPDGKRIVGSPGIKRDRRPGRPGRYYTGIGWKEIESEVLNFIKIDRVISKY